MICDAKNHKYFDLKEKKVFLDVDYCKNTLIRYQKVVRLFNVNLIRYLQLVQNVVDCNHYLKSYDMNFFDSNKIELMNDTEICLNNLNSKSFLRSCKGTCEQLKLSKVNTLIEGDFEFIVDAINLFEKFFDFKESGNFISMKLRMFFKKYVISRKLTKKNRRKFLKLSQHYHEVSQAEKGYKKVRKLIKATSERKLKQTGDQKEIKTNSKNDKENKKERILAAKKKKKAKGARLIYNKELYNFYNEITLSPQTKKEYVYHIVKPPTDIDKLSKVYLKTNGIDPLDYLGKTSFKMNHNTFYKMIFSYRKCDKVDSNLIFFLADFTTKTRKIMIGDLQKIFKPRPRAKGKKSRLLAGTGKLNLE